MKLITNSWPLAPKQGRYLDLDSRQLGDNLTAVRYGLWQRHVVDHRSDILTFRYTFSASDSVRLTHIAHQIRPKYHDVSRWCLRYFGQGECRPACEAERSRCAGEGLEHLGMVMFFHMDNLGNQPT